MECGSCRHLLERSVACKLDSTSGPVFALQFFLPQGGVTMITRYVCGAVTAGVLTCGFAASAQTSREGAPELWKQMAAQDRAGSGSTTTSRGMPVTLTGCLQREADYRRQNQSGKGGPAGTGAGLGNEFVLVNVASSADDVDCTVATVEAYELTGSQERQLEPFVGKVVQISGMLKDATIDTAAFGQPPTGGFDPLGQDLRLREVEIASFAEPAAAPATVARAEPPAQDAIPEQRQPAPIGTTGQAVDSGEQLPATASPLPLAGLLGLLSLGGAAGIRALGRHRR
jgi:hypothetical protein